MPKVTARASATVNAPPERVMEALRDYQARPDILTDNFTACRVEAGGTGTGTIFAYHFAAGGRERDYRLRVEETGHTLAESDELSSFVSTWTVEPGATEAESRVTLGASWDGAGGIGGVFERLFAPLGLRRIYDQVLTNLARSISARA